MTGPGNIRGETDAGAAIGTSTGMPLSADFPTSPTGADTKSAQIATELTAFLRAGHADTTTYNESLDALREGLTAAPQAIEATDQAGAAGISNSGGTYI